jgi:hypothetical protein
MSAAAILVFIAIGVMICTEVLRSVVDRRRRERDGLGGTQDIAICGMLFGWICVVGAIVCGVGWVFQL